MEKQLLFQKYGMTEYKRMIGFFAGVGFVLGILAANTFAKKVITDLGLFGDYFFMQMEQVKVDAGTLFWYVFEKRMLFILVLLLLGVTSFGCIAAYALTVKIGCSVGFVLSACVMQNGFQGLGICMMGLFPQELFYIPAGFVMVAKTCQISHRLYGRDCSGIYNRKKELLRYAAASAVVMAVFFIGIVTESLLNPVLLQKIYSFFNNM